MSEMRECKKHGLTSFMKAKDKGMKLGYRFRCTKCSGEAVLRRKQKIKRILVETAGGSCKVCGYSKYTGALEFHHLDPSKKDRSVDMACGRSLDWFLNEIKKCVLLCSNCHREVEAGIAKL
jgi:5-methylcytosine-specific restriction endonuclease McrA